MNEATELEKARAEIKALHKVIDELSYRFAEEITDCHLAKAAEIAKTRMSIASTLFMDKWSGVLDGLTPRDVENAVKLARSSIVFYNFAYRVSVYGEHIDKDGGNGGIEEFADELMRGAEIFEEYGIERDWFMEFNADRIRERYERERAAFEADAKSEGE